MEEAPAGRWCRGGGLWSPMSCTSRNQDSLETRETTRQRSRTCDRVRATQCSKHCLPGAGSYGGGLPRADPQTVPHAGAASHYIWCGTHNRTPHAGFVRIPLHRRSTAFHGHKPRPRPPPWSAPQKSIRTDTCPVFCLRFKSGCSTDKSLEIRRPPPPLVSRIVEAIQWRERQSRPPPSPPPPCARASATDPLAGRDPGGRDPGGGAKPWRPEQSRRPRSQSSRCRRRPSRTRRS